MNADMPPAQPPATVILMKGLAEVGEERSRRFAACRQKIERATSGLPVAVPCTEQDGCGCALHTSRKESQS